ncbi:MAG: hypothetical protein AB7S38_34020 [Vulcanimicrobiota bacterium]
MIPRLSVVPAFEGFSLGDGEALVRAGADLVAGAVVFGLAAAGLAALLALPELDGREVEPDVLGGDLGAELTDELAISLSPYTLLPASA